jgi:hypothetical protein
VTSARKMVQDAVDAYFSGRLTVSEAFEKAYGPDTRRTTNPSHSGTQRTARQVTAKGGKAPKKS